VTIYLSERCHKIGVSAVVLKSALPITAPNSEPFAIVSPYDAVEFECETANDLPRKHCCWRIHAEGHINAIDALAKRVTYLLASRFVLRQLTSIGEGRMMCTSSGACLHRCRSEFRRRRAEGFHVVIAAAHLLCFNFFVLLVAVLDQPVAARTADGNAA
jgi:hypothetical protein